MLNEIFGGKPEHFTGAVPNAVMRLTAFPIKAIDLSRDMKLNGIKSEIKTVEVNVECDKKLSDYNKIIPRCDPACPSSPSEQKPQKKPCCPSTPICPPKKKKGCGSYPGCKPKKCVLGRNLSTLLTNYYKAKDNIGVTKRDPANPSIDPHDPHNPEENPFSPEQNPREDPNNPDKPDPGRRDDSPK